MKKITFLSLFFLMVLGLIGCSQMKKEDIDIKQMKTAKEVITKIQEDLETNNEKVINGVLTDVKSKEPLYREMDIYSEKETKYFPSIKHFNLDEISGGYILEAFDPTKSAELIIVVEAKGSEAADGVNKALQKVLSDQYKEWEEHIPKEYQLVKMNKIEYQGDFLLYVTSKEHKKIIKSFQEITR